MRRDAGADRVANPLSFKAADVAAHAHADLFATPYGPADVVTFLVAVVSAVAPADARADRGAQRHTYVSAVASADARADRGAQRRTDALSDDVAAIVAADIPAHRRALSVADRRADGAADARSVWLADDGRTDWTSNDTAPDAAALKRTVARA